MCPACLGTSCLATSLPVGKSGHGMYDSAVSELLGFFLRLLFAKDPTIHGL